MEVINIYLKRKFLTNLSTTGDFFCDELKFHYACLEDPVRDEKIPRITAIGEGVYLLKWKTLETPLTLKYRSRFDWFKWHIHITDVPLFDDVVYIHIGNKAENSDGCVLLGMSRSKDKVNSSVDAFHSFYEKISPYLDNKNYQVYLHVENCF